MILEYKKNPKGNKILTRHVIHTLSSCKTSHLGKLLVTSQTHPRGGQRRDLETLTDGRQEGGGGRGGGCKRRLIPGPCWLVVLLRTLRRSVTLRPKLKIKKNFNFYARPKTANKTQARSGRQRKTAVLLATLVERRFFV